MSGPSNTTRIKAKSSPLRQRLAHGALLAKRIDPRTSTDSSSQVPKDRTREDTVATMANWKGQDPMNPDAARKLTLRRRLSSQRTSISQTPAIGTAPHSVTPAPPPSVARSSSSSSPDSGPTTPRRQNPSQASRSQNDNLGPIPLNYRFDGELINFRVGNVDYSEDYGICHDERTRQKEKVPPCPFKLTVYVTAVRSRKKIEITALANRHDHPPQKLKKYRPPRGFMRRTSTVIREENEEEEAAEGSEESEEESEEESAEEVDGEKSDAQEVEDEVEAKEEYTEGVDAEEEILNNRQNTRDTEAKAEASSAGLRNERKRSNPHVEETLVLTSDPDEDDADRPDAVAVKRPRIENSSCACASSSRGPMSRQKQTSPLEHPLPPSLPAPASLDSLKEYLNKLVPDFSLRLQDGSGPFQFDYFAPFVSLLGLASSQDFETLREADAGFVRDQIRKKYLETMRKGKGKGKEGAVIKDFDWDRVEARLRIGLKIHAQKEQGSEEDSE
ncbi:hypothetical protein JCM3765_000677 [Sporobolomyces pararoseus]